ncbi:MAG: type IV pilus assembly protein PilM [Candidatus Manganitrophus sp.]|nr:MAG: type IV pilus assembly protein PilM [Candidatus Manganitrophus sp.]
MGWLPFRKPFWAIDIGASSVKVVRLGRTRQGVKLLDIGLKELPMDQDLRQENITAALDELIKEKKRPKAVINFSGQAPLIRYLTLPAMPKEELAEAVKWEAKKLVSIPMEEMILDFIIAGGRQERETKRYDLILVVAERSSLCEQWAMMQRAGLDIVAIDVNPLSLLNTIRMSYGKELTGNFIYIDIGAAKTDMTILKDGVLRFTRRLEMGGEQITRRLEREMGLPYEEAEKLKREKGVGAEEGPQAIIKNEIDRFIVEIQRSIDYYRAQFREGVFKKVILMGGGALLPGFSDYFGSYFDAEMEIDDPLAEIIGTESVGAIRAIAPRFSSGIGLALRSHN